MPGVGTTHHVYLAGHYYIVKPGSYMKKAAPQFGARFSTGDPDLNNLSMWQHWAQRCFIGGLDQDDWADDAMYDEGIGLDTTFHETVTLARDLRRGTGSGWSVSTSASPAACALGSKAIIYNNKLYLLTLANPGTRSHLWEYDPTGDGWNRITALDSADICGRSIAVFDGKLLIGGFLHSGATPRLAYSTGALGTWSIATAPTGAGTSITFQIRAMRSFQQRLYVAYGTQVFRLKDDGNWDGNTVFYKANEASESNVICAMEVHLGFLYMLSTNGHIHRTDGNTTFNIWNWDGQTDGVAIKSFDGRLFVLTYEYSNTSNVGYGVLYQMSGSAVTQLKRWGNAQQATRIGNMTVYDRKLWYGASNLLGLSGLGTRSGFGVAVYDPIEDAHSIAVSNSDTTTYSKGSAPYEAYLVDDQIFFMGKLFAFVRGHGAFYTKYQPRDAKTGEKLYDTTASGGSVGSLNGGWLTTSTYDAGTPGVKKLWRKIIIDAAIPTGCSIFVEYSIDDGLTYATAGSATTVSGRREYEFRLLNKIGVSFKLRLTFRSTNSLLSPTMYGFVVSYIPVPEPNWMWSFTIALADNLELLDGTLESPDTEAELTFLGNLWRSKELVSFRDAQGALWATDGSGGVLIYDMTVALRDLNQPLEGEVTLTLLEAVETY